MNIFLSAPQRSAREVRFNETLADSLRAFGQVHLPKLDCSPGRGLQRQVRERFQSRNLEFQSICESIRESDLVVAVLNIRDVDQAVAFELGMAFTLSVPCVALTQELGHRVSAQNVFAVEECLTGLFRTERALLKWVREYSSPILSFG